MMKPFGRDLCQYKTENSSQEEHQESRSRRQEERARSLTRPKATRAALVREGGKAVRSQTEMKSSSVKRQLAAATVRKMICKRNNADANAVMAASQTANAVFTTQPGAAPARRSRSGRKFHVVMCR